MINLLPWRERLVLKNQIIALSVIITALLLLFTPSGILLSKTYHQKMEDEFSVQRLQHEVNQLRLHAKKNIEKEVSQKQLIKMSAIVWKRYYFIEKSIHLIMRIPDAIRLAKLYCVKETCQMELHVENPSIFRALFSAYKVQDVKQGDCLLCYQVEVTVPL